MNNKTENKQEEKELQKYRQNKVRRNRITLAILKYIVIALAFSSICLGFCIWMDGNMNDNIKIAKDSAYKLYNEGLAKSISYHYDYKKIVIEYADPNEVDILYNQGIKYLQYPDIIYLKIDDEIKYSNSRFYYSSDYKHLDVEVIVPKNHEAEIDYYKYKLHIKTSTVITSILFGLFLTFLWFIIAEALFKNKN